MSIGSTNAYSLIQAGGLGEFYLCTQVFHTTRKWKGKLVTYEDNNIRFDTNESDLVYFGFSPCVGKIYTKNAEILVSHYSDTSDLTFHDQYVDIVSKIQVNKANNISYDFQNYTSIQNNGSIYVEDRKIRSCIGTDGNVYVPSGITTEYPYLMRINTTTDTLEPVVNLRELASDNFRIYSLVCTENGIVYISTGNRHIYKVNIYTNEKEDVLAMSDSTPPAMIYINKKIYIITDWNVRILNTQDDTLTSISADGSLDTVPLYAPNGYLYLVPPDTSGSRRMRKMNLETTEIEYINVPEYRISYVGMGYNGIIYGLNNNHLTTFDTSSDTLTYQKDVIAYVGSYDETRCKMVTAPDGKLYSCGGSTNASLMRFDPETNGIEYLYVPTTPRSGILAPNGSMYFLAYNTNQPLLKISPQPGLVNFATSTIMGPYTP